MSVMKAVSDYQYASKLQDEMSKKLDYENNVDDAKYYLHFVLETKKCAAQLLTVNVPGNIKYLAEVYIKSSENLIHHLLDFIKVNSKDLPN